MNQENECNGSCDTLYAETERLKGLLKASDEMRIDLKKQTDNTIQLVKRLYDAYIELTAIETEMHDWKLIKEVEDFLK